MNLSAKDHENLVKKMRDLPLVAMERDLIGLATARIRRVGATAEQRLVGLEVMSTPEALRRAAFRRLRQAPARAPWLRPAWLWAPAAALSLAAAVLVWVNLPGLNRSAAPVGPTSRAPVEPPVAARVQPEPVVIASATVVQRNGRPMRLSAGAALEDGDQLETGPEAGVVLNVGEVQVRLERRSTLTFSHAAGGAAAVTLLAGAVEGRARRRSAMARLEFRHQDRAVRLLAGGLGVLRAGPDRLALAALGGETAEVEIDGKRVTLEAGFAVWLGLPGQEVVPQPMAPVLSLELQSVRPAKNAPGRVVVAGKTQLDVLLYVNGSPVPVDNTGSFVAKVEGMRRGGKIVASVRDAAGRSRQISATGVPLSTDVKWGPG